MEPVESAVFDFGHERFAALARRVLWRLQRIDATGIYGDDRSRKSLWDEFCYQTQEGPDVLEGLWDTVIEPLCEEIVGALSKAERRLLFFASSEGASWEDDGSAQAPLDHGALICEVREALAELAADREMD
jgi:hypothetical protein